MGSCTAPQHGQIGKALTHATEQEAFEAFANTLVADDCGISFESGMVDAYGPDGRERAYQVYPDEIVAEAEGHVPLEWKCTGTLEIAALEPVEVQVCAQDGGDRVDLYVEIMGEIVSMWAVRHSGEWACRATLHWYTGDVHEG